MFEFFRIYLQQRKVIAFLTFDSFPPCLVRKFFFDSMGVIDMGIYFNCEPQTYLCLYYYFFY